MNKYENDLLLELTIKNGINLWTFNQLFTEDGKNKKCEFDTYQKYWRDISIKPLSKYDFTTVCKLLEKYKKG